MARREIYTIENLVFSTLAFDGVYEFAVVFAPVTSKGATRSPGNSIAIK
jgi:hypothetical protein